MSRISYCLAALLLLVTTSVYALTEKSFRAYVVSVDAAKKSITFRVPDDAKPPKWNELVATWDDKTEWQQAPEKIYQKKPADSGLAKTLKKDSKVYVSVSDDWSNAKTWLIQRLVTMPPDESVP